MQIVKKKKLREILNLFQKVFKKKISLKYYNWRYYDKKLKEYSSIIKINNINILCHIGFVKNYIKIDNKKYVVFSRHSSMVKENFQRKKIYSQTLSQSFKYLKKNRKSDFIVAFPNKKNLGTNKNLKKEYCLRKFFLVSNVDKFINKNKKNLFKRFNQTVFNKLKKELIFKDNSFSFFLKDSDYVKHRYLSSPHDIYYYYYDKIYKILFIFKIGYIQNERCIYLLDIFIKNLFYQNAFNNFYDHITNQNYPIALWYNSKNSFIKNLKRYNLLKQDCIFHIMLIKLGRKNINSHFYKKNFFLGDTDITIKTS